ncbi:hypothetical protein D3C81_474170 [compost metagenome]
MRLAVRASSRHPGLDVVLLVRLQRHIAGTDRHDPVWQLQQLQNMLGIAQNLLKHRLRHLRVALAEHDLLDLRELMDAV